MADYFWGRLEIQATDYLRPLVKTLLDDRKFEEVVTENGIMSFSDSNAMYGEFEDEENELVTMGVSFDRESSCFDSTQAKRRVFRPKMFGREIIDKVYDMTSDYFPIVNGDALGNILGAPATTEKEKLEQLDKILALYEQSCFTGPELSDLVNEVEQEEVNEGEEEAKEMEEARWLETDSLFFVKAEELFKFSVLDAYYKRNAALLKVTIDVSEYITHGMFLQDISKYVEGKASIDELRVEYPTGWMRILAENIAKLDFFTNKLKNHSFADRPFEKILADKVSIDPLDGKMRISICQECFKKYDLPQKLMEQYVSNAGACSLSGCKGFAQIRCIVS